MAIVLADANFTKEDIAMDRQPPDSKIYLNHTLEDYASATFRCPREPTLILGVCTVCEARLILGQPRNHVFSQLPGSDSRISIAPRAPSCKNTHIRDHLLIEPLMDADHTVIRAIRALSIYKKVLPT